MATKAGIPIKWVTPWAANAAGAYIRSIPATAGSDPSAASQALGFPPITFEPIAAGGIPPDGQDANGALNYATSWNQWQQLGGPITWDSAVVTNQGGYPLQAFLSNANSPGYFWVSTVDNNTSNPDTGGANWLSFGPSYTANTPYVQVFNTNISPTLPPTGLLQFYDTAASGTQTVTFSASGLTPGLSILQLNNLGSGAAQFVSTTGVYVNFPTGPAGSFNQQFPVQLYSNAVPQGVWQNTTYGTVYPNNVGVSGHPVSALTFLVLSSTQTVCVWASDNKIGVAIWNPTTKTLGTVYTFSGGAFGNLSVLPLTGGFTIFSSNFIIAGTASGSLITFGSPYAPGGQSPCQAFALTATTYLFVYSVNGGPNLRAAVVSVSGTTISVGSTATYTGSLTGAISLGSAIQVSATLAVASVISVSPAGFAVVTISVSGTTVTFATVAGAPSVTSLYFVPNSASKTLFLAYSGTLFYAVSVSGSTVTFSASGSVPSFTGAPPAIPLGPVNIVNGASNSYLASNGANTYPVSIAGGAITVGTPVAAPSLNVLYDGTFAYLVTITVSGVLVSQTITTMTISGSTIAVGTIIDVTDPDVGNANGSALNYNSINFCFAAYKIGSTYYGYAVTPALGNVANSILPINAQGDSIGLGGVISNTI